MTSPSERKTMQVSTDVHASVYELAQELGLTADGVLRRLLDKSSVHIPLSGVQRERWEKAAQFAGVPLDQFIVLRVEAALEYGTDPGTMRLIYDHVRTISAQLRRAAGR